MRPLNVDDVYRHGLWLTQTLDHKPMSAPSMKLTRSRCLKRFVRTFTEPGRHRAELMRYVETKYG